MTLSNSEGWDWYKQYFLDVNISLIIFWICIVFQVGSIWELTHAPTPDASRRCSLSTFNRDDISKNPGTRVRNGRTTCGKMFELYGVGKDGMVYRSPPPRRKEVDILEVGRTWRTLLKIYRCLKSFLIIASRICKTLLRTSAEI